MTLRTTAFALLALLGWHGNPAHAQFYSGVTVHSFSSELNPFNSSFDHQAIHTADGSGLTGTTHHNGSDGVLWTANTFTPSLTTGPTDTAPSITFDLGAVLGVGGTHVWNYNAAGFTFRGADQVRIRYSTDDTTYTTLGQFQFAEATGQGDYTGQFLNLPDFTARYVAFDILTNHAGDLSSGTGLSEVRFTPIPEPGCALLLGAGSVGAWAVRRRWDGRRASGADSQRTPGSTALSASGTDRQARGSLR